MWRGDVGRIVGMQLDVLFKYYDLIGHTRTIAAFRRKPGGVRPHDGEWREHIAGFHLRPY
jgi:hypothetical protein